MMPPPVARSRGYLLLAIVLVIVLGLVSRMRASPFPEALGQYPGDALWALMVFLLWAWCLPRLGSAALAGLALFSAWGIELLQLYQASWIMALRATTPGHLVLGSHFLWQDLLAYAAGVGLGVWMDRLRLRWNGAMETTPR